MMYFQHGSNSYCHTLHIGAKIYYQFTDVTNVLSGYRATYMLVRVTWENITRSAYTIHSAIEKQV